MSSKSIALLLSLPPFGSSLLQAGLRAAVGLASGVEGHRVSLFLQGGAARLGAAGLELEPFEKDLKSLQANHVPIYAEEEPLKFCGMAPDRPIIPLSRAEFWKKLKDADLRWTL